MAEFHASKTKVQAQLTNGLIIECETELKASGDYKSWFEAAPLEHIYGWRVSERKIDDSTIEPLYADEFNTNLYIHESLKIKSIIKVLEEPVWEVQAPRDEFDEDDEDDEESDKNCENCEYIVYRSVHTR